MSLLFSLLSTFPPLLSLSSPLPLFSLSLSLSLFLTLPLLPPLLSSSSSSPLSSVLPSSFKVRSIQSSDLPAVEKLVGGLEGGDGVVADVKRYVEARRDPLGEGATPLSAVVAECAHQVVGVAIVRQEEVSAIWISSVDSCGVCTFVAGA